MRILLDQGIFDMRNAGQNALTQANVERIQKLWPQASIEITTVAPHLMKLYFPNANPVSPDGRHAWYKNRDRFNRMHRLVPPFIWRFMLALREELWHRSSTHVSDSEGWEIKSSLRTDANKNSKKVNNLGTKVDYPINYTNVVSGFDLFIAGGSQYMCDHARGSGIGVMNRLEAAIQSGIPTAMVGQGIGPLDGVEIRAKAKAVLPKVDLIFVRERLEAPEILSSLGVDPTKVFITGDDAVGLVYRSRSSAWGTGIGVGMRAMPSTMVNKEDIQILGSVIKRAASKYEAQLVGLPISRSVHERDDEITQQLLDGYGNIWIIGSKFPTPLEIIKNTQRCRLVIASTFHAAIFALAQGIPVICLAKSALYKNKFITLADLFNPGCRVILLDDEQLEKKLAIAIDATWQSAEEVRLKLLEAAARQIEWNDLAYQRLFEMVESKK